MGVEDLEDVDAPPLAVGKPIVWPRRPLPFNVNEAEAMALLGEVGSFLDTGQPLAWQPRALPLTTLSCFAALFT